MSGDNMLFPKTAEQFVKEYEFKDRHETYTNGAMLIPSFRVQQMIDHYINDKSSKSTPKPKKLTNAD